MNEEPAGAFRLCPKCANSIDANREQCPYCKADLAAGFAPPWLNRNQVSPESRAIANDRKKFPIPVKYLWSLAMFGGVLGAFLAGGYLERGELSALSQANSKQLQAKDQIIQSQQEQLVQVQKQLTESSDRLAELKTKLQETQKDLTARQQRLAAAPREVKNVNAARIPAVRRTPAPGPDASQSYPQPTAARRSAAPGVYETTRATSVYETPSSASRTISQIGQATRINVINAAGDWLEVRSKHGNPPGYVRADDARMIAPVN